MRRNTKPEWYEALMRQSFHEICGSHENHFVDFFCFYCHHVGCSKCADSHPRTTSKQRALSALFLKTRIVWEHKEDFYRHPIMQVFELLEHDAAWLDCISEFVDCSGIQTHDFEGGKLVVLKPKQQVMTCHGICRKFVRKPFKFCSVACKVNHLSDDEEDLSQLFKSDTFKVNHPDTNDRFAPDPPKRPVGSKGQKNPKQSQGLTQSMGYSDQNVLVERCARQPRYVPTTSQGLTLPAEGDNDQNALLQRSNPTNSGHDDQLQSFDFLNAGGPSLISGSDWLLGEQNDQNALVEHCAGQPRFERTTSQGLTLPAEGYNDQNALLRHSTATNSDHDQLLTSDYYDADVPDLLSSSEWLLGEQNDQNVPGMPFGEEPTAEYLIYLDSEPAEDLIHFDSEPAEEDRGKDEPKKLGDEEGDK